MKNKLPEYLYIYRESNTVIQLYLDVDKTAYVYNDGDYEDEALIDGNLEELERLMNGSRCVELKFTSGDYWDVYGSPIAAFGLDIS